MFQITVAGRVGKTQGVKEVSGTSVLNFSLATDVGFGDRKQTVWFDCAIWGKRADSLAQYISKGIPVTVIGEGGERSYESDSGTKHVITIRVSEIALQGRGSEDSGQQDSHQSQRDSHQDSHQPQGGGIADDDVPFQAHEARSIA